MVVEIGRSEKGFWAGCWDSTRIRFCGVKVKNVLGLQGSGLENHSGSAVCC